MDTYHAAYWSDPCFTSSEEEEEICRDNRMALVGIHTYILHAQTRLVNMLKLETRCRFIKMFHA